MYYVTNPDIQPNYSQIKNNFENIKNNKLKNTIPETNILISNNRDSHSRGNFYLEREKYIGKIISIFLIQKKGIEYLVGPILLTSEQTLMDIMNYVNEFIPCDNVYIEELENLDNQILNYYKMLNVKHNDIKFTNITYN